MNFLQTVISVSRAGLNHTLILQLRWVFCAYFIVIGLSIFKGAAIAADTDTATDIYLQNRDALIQGYQSQGAPLTKEYSDWKAAASKPAKPGIHGNRYLMTYVNDIGHSTYVEYAPIDVTMPVGSIVAKESFKLSGTKFKPGPLFFMEKVGIDKAPKADGWFYSRVKQNGKPMKSSQRFCHGCHKAYSGQDALGYPALEARLPSNDLAAVNVAVIDDGSVLGDSERGKSAAQVCMACHQVGSGAKNGVGPVLNGIVGRPAASYPKFKYSPSLEQAGKQGLVWSEAELFAWLAGPGPFLQQYLQDTEARSQMTIQFADTQLRKDIIAYFKSLSES